jgi:hypothetical protein
VDRIGSLGNGQVPIVAATAWRILTHNVEVRGRTLLGDPSSPPG